MIPRPPEKTRVQIGGLERRENALVAVGPRQLAAGERQARTQRRVVDNRFKGPILRGLAARAPYFHNGSAATLSDVVEFYETRFQIGLTPREKADLIAFLRALYGTMRAP